ncbi:MAG TPA: hypothetical protein VGJ36_01285 [Gemmatimonadales bacterium]|jgi:hypothetical protein
MHFTDHRFDIGIIGMRKRGASDERGSALAVAVFALVVIGGIVAGNFFAGLLEQQSGRNTLFISQAAEAAETGLRDAFVALPASTLLALPAGGAPMDLEPLALNSGVSVGRQVSRLTDHLFLLRAQGTRHDADGTPLATRAIGLLIQLSTGSAAAAPLTQRGWLQLY